MLILWTFDSLFSALLLRAFITWRGTVLL